MYFGYEALKAGDWKRALEFYRTALRIWPDLPQKLVAFNYQYGKLLLDMGRLDEAAVVFARAAAMDPTSSVPHYNLGLIYGRWGKYRDSEAALLKSLELNSEEPETYNTLSRLMIEVGRYNEAVSWAEKAIRRKPDFLWSHFNRAWALEKLGRLQEAKAGYERVQALDPGLGEAAARLAHLRSLMARGS